MAVQRVTVKQLIVPLSLEFSLLVDCCRRSSGGGGDAGINFNAGLDWPLFLRLARFHRVQGLVWASLSEVRDHVPVEVVRSISADASGIAADNLRAAIESKRLLASFSSGGIDVMFVKGLTLGALAYPNPAIKFAVDIDLLVAEADLIRAAEFLQRAGYRLKDPAGSYDARRLLVWHQAGKESTWLRAEPRSVVDLHTRLSDHPRLIPTVGLNSPRRDVEIGDAARLPTLRDEELVAYLCVHGASSAWFRLKWITDLAALLHARSASDLEHLYTRSQELGAARAADQALLLADALYGTLACNTPLQNRLQSDRTSRWLCDQALKQLTRFSAPLEPTARRLGTVRIHLTQFMLVRGWSFKASEFVRQARAAIR